MNKLLKEQVNEMMIYPDGSNEGMQSITPAYDRPQDVEFEAHGAMDDATSVTVSGVRVLVYSRKFSVVNSLLPNKLWAKGIPAR